MSISYLRRSSYEVRGKNKEKWEKRKEKREKEKREKRNEWKMAAVIGKKLISYKTFLLIYRYAIYGVVRCNGTLGNFGVRHHAPPAPCAAFGQARRIILRSQARKMPDTWAFLCFK